MAPAEMEVVVAAVPLPEQHRPAFLAEAALRGIAGAEPFEPVLPREDKVLVRAGRGGHVGAGLLAALEAVAGDDGAQVGR